MSDEVIGDDGYFLHRALWSLRNVGSSKGDGWSTIREFWEALAKGDVDDKEAARWAREIALRVVGQNVFGVEARERPRRALASLGLVGFEGTHREESEHLQMLAEFSELIDEDKRHLQPTRRRIAQQMIKSGYFQGMTEQQAMKSIENIQRSLPPKK